MARGVRSGAACGEMISGVPQATLVEAAGAPTDVASLSRALGSGWRGGYVGPTQFDKLMGLGRPWAAELYDGGKLGHFVTVDGRMGSNLLIRDPWAGGSKYQMTLEEFLRMWTGNAVFK
jgi:Peptidase C39 family